MTQTATQWLIEEIHKNMGVWIPPHIQDQAKAMEKEQHSNTWVDSRIEYKEADYIGKQISSEDYYNKTYNQ